MDSMILTRQKNTLAEYMILSGADNRPPLLDKDLYDSWKKNGVTRIKKYVELSPTEKIQADCDIKEINIILQGLSTDIYSLQERECKLYDVFDKFTPIKGESLPQYYLRFTHLMNDMNIYNMKLEQFQVNTKFLNSLPPEWIKQQTHLAEFPQIDSGLAVHVFKQGDNPIDAINKMMSFMSTVGRQNSYVAGTSGTRANTSGIGGNYSCQQRVMKCFNYQGEGHMARQCPKPKRKRDATWFREKVLLVEAQGNGKVLNEEELEFLADPGIAEAKAVLMANLSSYGSDVLSEVPISDNTNNDMLNQSVQEMPYSEPSHFVEHPENEIHSDSNIIPYSQYLIESQNAAVNNDNLIANESLSAELERYKERVKLLEERQNVDLGTREKLIIDDIIREKNAQFADFEKEINNLKQTLSEQSKEKELLTKTFNVFKNESKEKEAKNIDTEIALEKKVKELDNIVCKIAQQIRPMLYDGNVIAKETNVISIADSEETLMLEEESQSEMLLKQSDPMVLEKKVNTKPIDYAELNRLFEDFGKRLVPQRELSDEQALHPIIDQSASSPVKIEAPGNFLRCLELEAELIKQHSMVEKDEYNILSKRFSELEQHYISLEIAMQINKELFQKNNTSEKVFVITTLKNDLRKLKGKEIADNATTIAPGMYKLDQVILAPKVKNNREAHEYYLQHTMEQAAILRVKPSTSASGSKPLGNTKNDRISRTSNSNEKIKVEVQSRKVKSKLNKQNSDSKNVCNEHVKHPIKGAQPLCFVCNECLFDANHAMCLIDHVNSMNVRDKSTSKKNKKRKEWKPTEKVFNSVGYKWKPIGRTLTLVGNACHLTRIIATNKVPLRVPIPLEIVAPEHVVTRVYTRRPKVPKSVPNSKPKVLISMTAYRMELGTSRGSNTLVASSSSSLIDCRLSKLFCGI
ncbi:retrovirus-related pol polyprotein from transposon TNT 1-94 [Tanacetum coccineum]